MFSSVVKYARKGLRKLVSMLLKIVYIGIYAERQKIL